ncbi:MAG: SMC-Scp complex subunit ScpB [Clostridia bacterium]|nr:SMC-Scp complex subunit ScpB [Clostridia bacterium]
MSAKPILEAVLFAAGHPLTYEVLAEAAECMTSEVNEILTEMANEYSDHANKRGIQLVMYKDSCQLCTKEEHIDKIRTALGVRSGGNLSRSSMETLAIVAYHQPVTRSYIDSVRGIDSSYSVNNLTDKGLIEVCGRLDAPGRPSLYRTTENFLRIFGITSLDELPPVELFAIPELKTDVLGTDANTETSTDTYAEQEETEPAEE